MIDKVELRVSRNVPFTKEFQEVYQASLRSDASPWRSSGYYQSTADLRSLGYDARLHMYCRLHKDGNHKLEIYESGPKSLWEMQTLCTRIFNEDPYGFGVMRLDLCADVHGYSVGWFKRHTVIKGKQTHREFGSVVPYQTIRKGRAETIYAGVKPNQYRFYDKAAERLTRWHWYARRLRREAPDLIPVPYAEIYGHAPEAVITRAERQVSGRDLRKLGVTTFPSLKHAAQMQPFEKVIFTGAFAGEPDIKVYGPLRWSSGMYVRQLAEDFGLAYAHAWLRKEYGRNVYREFKHYTPFLRSSAESDHLTSDDLLKAFRESSHLQVSGASEARILTP